VTDVRPDIDLGALARPEASVQPPRRSRLRLWVPIVIMLAFAAVLATTIGDFFRGTVEVTVVRPRVESNGERAARGAVLFQAAGWVEPDPFPIQASALTDGVVCEVVVLESDRVEAGQVVARLFDEEAKLARDAAASALAAAEGEVARTAAEAELARANYDAALSVTEAEATARAERDGRAAERDLRAQAVAGGAAALRVAEEELAIQRELAAAGAAGPRQVELAEARVEEARSGLAGLRAEAALAAAEAEKAVARLERATRDRELRLDDSLRLRTAEAALATARARESEARAALEQARLRLARTEVRAPASGIVLERKVAPGAALSASGEGVVCTLYDPASLRVRVDVPQGEVGKAKLGQRALVLADSRPKTPYAGEVVRVVHKADIQKVTLQVHVRILDGDALLRPEMLCQVRFLASEDALADGTGAVDRLSIPTRLVDNGAVWVLDGASGRAALRRVEIASSDSEWAEVESGLNASDKLIDAGRERLSVDARVVVREER
jgi:RND family efflux transporter MFP subunit